MQKGLFDKKKRLPQRQQKRVRSPVKPKPEKHCHLNGKKLKELRGAKKSLGGTQGVPKVTSVGEDSKNRFFECLVVSGVLGPGLGCRRTTFKPVWTKNQLETWGMEGGRPRHCRWERVEGGDGPIAQASATEPGRE